jgi:hypothetical protein
MAFYIWGNEATVQGVLGILLVIFGSGLYAWVQMISSKPLPDKPAATVATAVTSSLESGGGGGGSGPSSMVPARGQV